MEPIRCEISLDAVIEADHTGLFPEEMEDDVVRAIAILDDNQDQPSVTILLTIKR